eukprot:GHVO01056715.1.p1 GENE.GHVO01056715.1~~GHVO01056715.1.p1  ORF type:complete len:513 (+),score=56.06 GHVO01056715.1:57-1595(+)
MLKRQQWWTWGVPKMWHRRHHTHTHTEWRPEKIDMLDAYAPTTTRIQVGLKLCHLIAISIYTGGVYAVNTFQSMISDTVCRGRLPGWDEKLSNSSHATFCWAVETAGPSYIKLLQWASTRSDIFPESCRRVWAQKFYSNTSLHDIAQTEGILKHELGSNWRDVLSINPSPIGSGCIGQVYEGVYKNGGKPRRVAVKGHCFSCGHTYALTAPLQVIWKWIPIKDSIDHFDTFLKEQLDLKKEGKNLERMRRNFRGHKCCDGQSKSLQYLRNPLLYIINKSIDLKSRYNVVVPQVHHQPQCPKTLPRHAHVPNDSCKCSSDILIQSYEHGTPLSEIVFREKSRLKRRVANIGVSAFFKMLFRHNFVHGDLHPGNVLVRKRYFLPTEMVLLDCGLVVSLSGNERKNMIDLFDAIARNDGLRAGRLILERSRRERCKDPDSFCRGIEDLMNTNYATTKIGEIVGRLIVMSTMYKVELDPSFTSLLIAASILDGIGRQMDPNVNMIEMAKKYIAYIL